MSSPRDEEMGLRPWQYTLVPVHGLSDDRIVTYYDCRPWSPKRGRRPISPVSARAERGPAAHGAGGSRPTSPTHSTVHGCTCSPIQVRYGKSGTPTTYRKPRRWGSAASARIDASVPQSCSSPLPERIDSPIGGCTYPTRVPYGLVATHKKLVQTSRSRPSSPTALSPGVMRESLADFDVRGAMSTDFLRPGPDYELAHDIYDADAGLVDEHASATQQPSAKTRRAYSPEQARRRHSATFRAKSMYSNTRRPSQRSLHDSFGRSSSPLPASPLS